MQAFKVTASCWGGGGGFSKRSSTGSNFASTCSYCSSTWDCVLIISCFLCSDLTDKLHSKEDEFASLCSELQVIKDTTLSKCYMYI